MITKLTTFLKIIWERLKVVVTGMSTCFEFYGNRNLTAIFSKFAFFL